jgi:hypothetical protein
MCTENNKIIADFMGAKVTTDTYFINGMYMTISDADLKYHSDWNWLMEVVEKIESLHFDFAIYTGSSVSVINTEDYPYKEIISLNGSSKKEAVYRACVDFIKWYNEQKN